MMAHSQNPFAKFLPFCSALIEKKNAKKAPEILQALNTLITRTSVEELEAIKDHLTFPFELYLQAPWLSENFTISMFQSLSVFHRRVAINDVQYFSRIVDRALRISIFKDGNTDTPRSASEDLRMAICDFLSVAFNSSTNDVKRKFFSEDSGKYMTAQLLHQSCKWMEEMLGISSIVQSCGNLILAICPSENDSGKELFKTACDILEQMTPGVTSKMVKVVQDPSAPLKSKSVAIRVWSRFVATMLGDSRAPHLELSVGLEGLSFQETENPSKEKWRTLATGNIANHYKVMAGICVTVCSDSSDNSVSIFRQNLCSCVALLTEKTFSTCKTLIQDHVLILSLLSVDSNDSHKLARSSLKKLMKKMHADMDDSEMSTLNENIKKETQERIFDNCQKLSKMTEYSDTNVSSLLWQLSSGIYLLNQFDDQSVFFLSETYLSQLVEALLTLVTLEDKSHQLFDQISGIFNTTVDDLLAKPHAKEYEPKKNFIFLTNDDLIERYKSIILNLSRSASLTFILEYLIEKTRVPVKRRNSILVLSDLVQGMLSESPNGKDLALSHQFLENLVENFLSEKTSSLNPAVEPNPVVPVQRRMFHDEKSVIVDWNSETLTVELIGRISRASERLYWNDLREFYLGKSLSVALTLTDVSDHIEAAVLRNTLLSLKEAFEYETVFKMLQDNVEFLTREVTLHLRRNVRKKGLITLLKVVLLCQSSDSRSALHDTLKTILTQLDLSWIGPEKTVTTELLRVLLVFIENLEKTLAKTSQETSTASSKEINNLGFITELVKGLKEAEDALNLADEDIVEEKEQCPSEGFHTDVGRDQEICDDNEPKELSDEILILKDVLEHTRHYISMVKCPQWQILALEIVSKAAVLLRMDKDELLPLIHLSWQPLKLLFQSNNLFVIDKALEVVHTFATIAGEFIRERTLTDVVKPMLQASKMLKPFCHDTSIRYLAKARQAKKTLAKLYRCLFEFLSILDLDEFEVDTILEELIKSDIVEFAFDENLVDETFIAPVRQQDKDSLWLKTNGATAIRLPPLEL